MSGNSSQIDIDELASEVMKGLSEYNELATSAMKKAVRKTANSVKKELNTTSPNASGKYADSWVASSVSETSYIKHMT
ncbi:MAG: HK97 gp10 family phage protein, partial [Oscillospiraceae bacterium]|nr:HK97 gp10 family phage protein [Oscillospiraceae bacterium]